jgi:hypothetical protein
MMIFIVLLSVSLIFSFGFTCGLCWSAYVMTNRAKQCRKAIWTDSEDEEARRLMPSFQQAVAVAASCWCDARVVRTPMDPRLGIVFAEKIGRYINALQWCSGSEDFGPDGKAYIGFERVCRPLMTPIPEIDITRLTVEQYRNLRENAPELLGLKPKDRKNQRTEHGIVDRVD